MYESVILILENTLIAKLTRLSPIFFLHDVEMLRYSGEFVKKKRNNCDDKSRLDKANRKSDSI